VVSESSSILPTFGEEKGIRRRDGRPREVRCRVHRGLIVLSGCSGEEGGGGGLALLLWETDTGVVSSGDDII
jgi:hypothetical protein